MEERLELLQAEHTPRLVWCGYRPVELPRYVRHLPDQVRVALSQLAPPKEDVVLESYSDVAAKDHGRRAHRDLVPAQGAYAPRPAAR